MSPVSLADTPFPTRGELAVLPSGDIDRYLAQLPGWQQQDNTIVKTFGFDNYYQTMAFVNAVAWIAHQTDHHPDMEVGYKTCVIHYTTHDIGGLSLKDMICAARIENLALQT